MTRFCCLAAIDNTPLDIRLVQAYERRLASALPIQRMSAPDDTCVMLAEASTWECETTITRVESLMGVGTIRLDNRSDLAHEIGLDDTGLHDLDVVLHVVARKGPSSVSRLVGDFAVIIRDTAAHALYAIRDAIGVRILHMADRGRFLTLASHAAMLDAGLGIDLDYIAQFLMTGASPSKHTPYYGVQTLPAGSILTVEGRRRRVERYWDAFAFTDAPADPDTAIQRFRELLTQAVLCRFASDGETWAQLSGGLDSSSLVSLAQWLAERGCTPTGLSGTVTIVDSLGSGDEREFSNTVLDRYGVRNETLVDYWPWQDDGEPPPLTDQPSLMYPFYARDRRMIAVARAGGARVLWSGLGPDHFLTGSPYLLADLFARGRCWAVLREGWQWAVELRTSFWKLMTHFVLTPQLPVDAQQRIVARHRAPVPNWIAPRFAKRYELPQRSLRLAQCTAPRGRAFAYNVAFQLHHLPAAIDRGDSDESMIIRYPYLDRRLVEFCLTLPAAFRAKPFATKWIQREAVVGILPDHVRERSGKGTIGARLRWAMNKECAIIQQLLRNPILAQLGCISIPLLRRAVNEAMNGQSPSVVKVFQALSLETWLRQKLGHWEAPGESTIRHAVGLGSAIPFSSFSGD